MNPPLLISAGLPAVPLVYSGLTGGTITAAGPITLTAPPAWIPGQSRAAAIELKGCSNVVIGPLVIDGAWTDQIAVRFTNCTGCKLQLSIFVRVGGPTTACVVSVVGGSNNIIDANTIDEAGCLATNQIRGIWVGNVDSADYERSPTITRNRVLNCQATGIAIMASNAIVRSNDVENCQGSGIAISGAAGIVSGSQTLLGSANALVEGNRCVGNFWYGLQSDSVAGSLVGPVTVRGNVFDSNGAAGVGLIRATGWTVGPNAYSGNKTGTVWNDQSPVNNSITEPIYLHS